MSGPSPHKDNAQNGMALLAVLWGIALLSMIAAVALATSLSFARMEANSLKIIRTRTLAEAAILRAVLGIIDPKPATRWRIDGVPQAFTFEGVVIQIRIEDEQGKIDLNTGRDDLIRGLFHAAAEPNRADQLADSVLAWRGEGNANDTAEAGARPRGGAFQSLDELKLLPGMSDDLFEQLLPALTLYSQRAAFDPQTAPALALRAMGQSAAIASAAITARGTPGQKPNLLDLSMSAGGRAFTLLIDVPDGDVRYRHRAVIRLTGDATRPYWILAWDEARAPMSAP